MGEVRAAGEGLGEWDFAAGVDEFDEVKKRARCEEAAVGVGGAGEALVGGEVFEGVDDVEDVGLRATGGGGP